MLGGAHLAIQLELKTTSVRSGSRILNTWSV
jgi:hypothetical protein